MSVSAAELRKLASLNLSPEQMAGVLEMLAMRVEADEARKAAQNERKRRQRAKPVTERTMSRDSHVTVHETVTGVSSPLPSPLVPPLSPAPQSPPIIPPTFPPSSAQQPSEPDEFDRLDAALRRIPGISGHPVFVDPVIAPIWKLVQAGADFKTQIRPEVERLAKRKKPISSWAFFVPGIRDSLAGRQDAPPLADDAEWQKRLTVARRQKAWDVKKWGAMPKQSGCRVPSKLLTDDDGNGWQEWRAAS